MAITHYKIETNLKWSSGSTTSYSGNNMAEADARSLALAAKETYDDIVGADWDHITGYRVKVSSVADDGTETAIQTYTGGNY